MFDIMQDPINRMIIGFIILLGGLFIVLTYDNINSTSGDDSSKSLSHLIIEDEPGIIFQGPVPSGYDVEHFRKTGETIK